jgi:hypothetical protein
MLQHMYTADTFVMDDFMSMSKLKGLGRKVTPVKPSGYFTYHQTLTLKKAGNVHST